MMLRGQDVILLLSLVGERERMQVRELASDVSYNLASTQRALVRLAEAGLYDRRRGHAPTAAAEEFLVHGVKYVFPVRLGEETRGFAAAWAVEPVASRLAPTNELPPVWPHPDGTIRGLALQPLHDIAIPAAHKHGWLARRLGALDTIRAGDVRLRNVAADLLVDELRKTPA